MEDFERFPSGADFMSAMVQGWLQKLGLRQNIDLQQELTSVDSADELLIFDASETGRVKTKKATVANVGSTIVGGGYAGSFTTVTATGLIDISGASAGQIKFPATQNPSSDPNTLDDYEWGTYTPTLVSTGGGAPTYGVQAGFYTRIGNRNLVNGRVVITAIGTLAAGTISVSGQPFTATNSSNNRSVFSMTAQGLNAAINNFPAGDIIENTTAMRILKFVGGTVVLLPNTDLTATSGFSWGGQYF